MPESPRWLIAKGDLTQAEKIIQEGAKINGKTIPQNLVSKMFPATDKPGSNFNQSHRLMAAVNNNKLNHFKSLLWLIKMSSFLVINSGHKCDCCQFAIVRRKLKSFSTFSATGNCSCGPSTCSSSLFNANFFCSCSEKLCLLTTGGQFHQLFFAEPKCACAWDLA